METILFILGIVIFIAVLVGVLITSEEQGG